MTLPPPSPICFFVFSSWWLLIRSGLILCGYPACVSHGVPGLRGHSTLPDSDRSIEYHSYYMSFKRMVLPPPPWKCILPDPMMLELIWSKNKLLLSNVWQERTSKPLRQPPTFILVCRLPVVLRADCIRTQVTHIAQPVGNASFMTFHNGGEERRSFDSWPLITTYSIHPRT